MGRPFQHTFRHVCAAGECPPDARGRPRPDPRRQDLGLPGVGGMFAASGIKLDIYARLTLDFADIPRLRAYYVRTYKFGNER
jgi:hypothetical protein